MAEPVRVGRHPVDVVAENFYRLSDERAPRCRVETARGRCSARTWNPSGNCGRHNPATVACWDCERGESGWAFDALCGGSDAERLADYLNDQRLGVLLAAKGVTFADWPTWRHIFYDARQALAAADCGLTARLAERLQEAGWEPWNFRDAHPEDKYEGGWRRFDWPLLNALFEALPDATSKDLRRAVICRVTVEAAIEYAEAGVPLASAADICGRVPSHDAGAYAALGFHGMEMLTLAREGITPVEAGRILSVEPVDRGRAAVAVRERAAGLSADEAARMTAAGVRDAHFRVKLGRAGVTASEYRRWRRTNWPTGGSSSQTRKPNAGEIAALTEAGYKPENAKALIASGVTARDFYYLKERTKAI